MSLLKRIQAVLLSALLLACLPAEALALSIQSVPRPSVTVMVYFDGSDLEENDGSATADINETEKNMISTLMRSSSAQAAPGNGRTAWSIRTQTSITGFAMASWSSSRTPG